MQSFSCPPISLAWSSSTMEGQGNCRTWEEETYWKHFHTLHFTIMLPSDFNSGLALPETFTENMKANLPEQAVLDAPNGVSWNVSIERDVKGDGLMFAGDGWIEFVKAYSLQKQNLLLFKYDRDNCFKVLIFNHKTSCENEASYFKTKSHEHNGDTDVPTNNKEDSDMVDVPIRLAGRTTQTRKASEDYFCDSSGKASGDSNEYETIEPMLLRKRNSAPQKHDDDFDEEQRNASHSAPSDRARKVQSSKTNTNEVCNRSERRRVTETEKAKAYDMAQQSVTDSSFTVVMRPSCVYLYFHLVIPAAWKANSYYKDGEEVLLRVKDRTWVTKFCVSINHRKGGFGRGWKDFARDNFLQEFDVCVFEPSKETKFILDVSIFRVFPLSEPQVK